VEDDQLVGIVSLADIARNVNRRAIVTRSLKAVSTPSETSRSDGVPYKAAMLGLSIVAIASTAIAFLTWNRSGRELRKQMADSDFYHNARQAVGTARDRWDDVASSKAARNLRQQVQTNMKGISNQLPRIEYKPPKQKSAIFH
jgi:gas vesicle protein